MTTTIMGGIPTNVYAMISGSGVITPYPKITDSTGSFLPLMTTADGKLMVDTEFMLSGTSLIVELDHATDSVTTWPSTASTGTYNQVSISQSAAQIVAANSARKSVAITNNNVEGLYVGFNNSVTSANGFKLAQGQAISFDIYTGGVWGIATSGTTVASYIEI